MTELIKSIIFAILGGVVLAVSIIEQSGWEIIGLGAAITVAAVACIIAEIVKRKKK